MSTGFKGSLLGIEALSIAGQTVTVKCQFVDPQTSEVHGTINHNIPLLGLGSSPEITETSMAFLSALRDHITRLHFEEPDVHTPNEVSARGISESLRGEADEPG